MYQVNIFQAKTELSKLIALLENKSEDFIVIARNGKAVARLVPEAQIDVSRRIGIARGRFVVPDSIDDDNQTVAELFNAAL